MASIDDLVAAAERAAADTPGTARAALDALPWLLAAIDDDRRSGLFDRWGRSSAVDESTREPLLPRSLFDALHAHAGLAASWPTGNAGLLHGYGSLLSLAPAPYGLTRDRWLGGALAAAYGLPADHFLPWTGTATLLARATEAATALLGAGEFGWYAPVDGRATRTALGAEHEGARPLAYAVAPSAGAAPLLVTTFPVTDADTLRRELDEASARLRWNAV